MSRLTASTAFSTPLPPKRPLSPSRSSTASRVPVEAPDGTAARPIEPSSSTTSTSTVGLPRLSRISRPTTFTIAVIFAPRLKDCLGSYGIQVTDERRIWRLQIGPIDSTFAFADAHLTKLTQARKNMHGRGGLAPRTAQKIES